jgi:putative peptidoglycan lipid II flippase
VLLFIGQNYLVPVFQNVNKLSPEDSQKQYNQAFMMFFGTGTLIAIVLFLTSDFIINIYMQDAALESKELAKNIFQIFLLTIPFSAAVSMLSALLQTVFEFKFPSISVLFLNVSVIIILFLFSKTLGIYVIPIGYLIGSILQFLYLLFKSSKYFKLNLKNSIPNYTFLKSLFGSSLLTIVLIESIGQLYFLLDRYFYISVTSGGIASLNYAYVIFMLPISIFSISLATVIFPKITKAINNSSREELERIYNESISVNIFIFMPITFIFFYFGEPIIKLAFERGKFLAESSAMTYGALKYYSLSLVFYSVYSVLNKIFYSINLAKVLLMITCFGIIIKLVFNFILVREFEHYGLAFSTSISYIFFFLISYFFINYKLKIRNRNLFFKELFTHLINAIFCLLIVSFLAEIITENGLFSGIKMILVFITVYLLNLTLLKHKSLLLLKQVLERYNLGRMFKIN